MARNSAIRVDNANSTQHPALILSTDPLTVLVGSDSRQYDLDAVVETFTQADLDPAGGGVGLTSPTRFDVCELISAAERGGFVYFIGRLTQEAWARVLAGRQSCY